MQVNDIKFLVNTQKYVVAQVKIHSITDNHIKIQTIAFGDDVNPLILNIPIDKAQKIMFDDYYEAKAELGAYLIKYHQLNTDNEIITLGHDRIELDCSTTKILQSHTLNNYPEKII
jgi:hypothetical protein